MLFNTSAYCQARSRLPEKFLEKLFSQVGQRLEEKVGTEYLWCGRNVLVIDGSTVSMPDTVENQQSLPSAKDSKAWMWIPNCKNWCNLQFSYWSRCSSMYRCSQHS
ncbi:hypothetical protein [uncultured Nostoc sp.]|uniref:hypothetical protein n=1 Tax=uncultured Nostoc sp. TaxID=340711 RepID=UPI0035CAE219